MIFLLFFAVTIPALLIANKMVKADMRRSEEMVDWIMNSDKRWYCDNCGTRLRRHRHKMDDVVIIDDLHQHNEMDQIVIDIQPDGYLVEDEHDYDDVDDNLNE